MIDTTKGTPGFHMKRLYRKLSAERDRLEELHLWNINQPPIDPNDIGYKKYKDLVGDSRSGFASMAVASRSDKCAIRSIRTSVDNDVQGDDIVRQLWRDTGLTTAWKKWVNKGLLFGICPLVLGVDDEGPTATVHDPRDLYIEKDSYRPDRVKYALLMTHDAMEQEDIAILWGLEDGKPHRWEARKKNESLDAENRRVVWNEHFELLPNPDVTDPDIGIPVVFWETEDGMGVFEKNLGALSRMDKSTFRRDTIAMHQAFKKIGLIGDLDNVEVIKDENLPQNSSSDTLQYALSSDPGSVWTFPEGTEVWESGQVDLSPVINSKRADVMEFAAIHSIPLSYITPDAAAQSAEGASLQRETNTSKVENILELLQSPTARIVQILLLLRGESSRAGLEGIVVDFAPIQRQSLDSRSQAAVAWKAAGVPWETIMTDCLGFDPEKVSRMRLQQMEDIINGYAETQTQPQQELQPPAITGADITGGIQE